jgi:hypothetical protein
MPRPLVLAVFLLPLHVYAQTPAPTPASPWKVETSASTQYLAGQDVNRIPVFGTRIEPSFRRGRLTVAARLLASALKDGVDLENPRTYSTLEAHGLIAFDIVGPVAIAGVYGVTRPSVGEDGPNCETWGGGALIGDGTGDRWLLVIHGKHTALMPSEQIGPSIRPTPDYRLLFATKYRLKDRTAFIADGAPLGKGWMLRAGIGVRLF